MGRVVDALMYFALRFVKRGTKPRNVMLVSARGPAEMVFLATVLPRFMRLARPGEDVTLLLRSDAAGMGFLFPRSLHLKKVEYSRLSELAYRWRIFRQLWVGNYRQVVSLDLRRSPHLDEAMILATGAPERAVIGPAAATLLATRVWHPGPARQDRIVRLSRYADFLGGGESPPALALMPDHRLPEAMGFEVPTVVIFPFSAIRGRQLKPSTWETILDALPGGWHVRIAGHPADFDRNPQFKLLFDRPRVTVDTSGFETLASVLLGSRMAIGADTAGMHLAILLGVPTLMVASAAWVGAGIPYDEAVAPANAHFLYHPMECQGCLDHCPFEAVQGMLPCVAEIADDAIRTAIGDMIARGGF